MCDTNGQPTPALVAVGLCDGHLEVASTTDKDRTRDALVGMLIGFTSDKKVEVVNDTLRAHLTAAGWQPPIDTDALRAIEEQRVADGGNVVGVPTPTPDPLYVLVQHSGADVVAVDADVYRAAEESGDVPELMDEPAQRAVSTVYTVLD